MSKTGVGVLISAAFAIALQGTSQEWLHKLAPYVWTCCVFFCCWWLYLHFRGTQTLKHFVLTADVPPHYEVNRQLRLRSADHRDIDDVQVWLTRLKPNVEGFLPSVQ